MVGSHVPPVALAARERLTVVAEAGAVDSDSTASRVTDTDRCPCLSGDAFGDCCAPLLRGAALAVTAGAEEVDMVIDVGAAVLGDLDAVRADIAAVRAAVPGSVLKVIVESAALLSLAGEPRLRCP